jgi:hypothetical protein
MFKLVLQLLARGCTVGVIDPFKGREDDTEEVDLLLR